MFAVVLFFFTITLCFTLISANEKVAIDNDSPDEVLSLTNPNTNDYFFPLKPLVGIVQSITTSIKTIVTMPLVLRRLTMAECCSWSAIMTFNLFFTDFVGQTVYNGDPGAAESTIERSNYDRGVRAASYGLLFHCVVGALYAPFLKPIIHRFGIHATFSFGMFTFALSMLVMYFFRNIAIINLMASVSGLGMASLTSIPYTLVMTYHANREVSVRIDARARSSVTWSRFFRERF